MGLKTFRVKTVRTWYPASGNPPDSREDEAIVIPCGMNVNPIKLAIDVVHCVRDGCPVVAIKRGDQHAVTVHSDSEHYPIGEQFIP
jgi:hypothetical protein